VIAKDDRWKEDTILLIEFILMQNENESKNVDNSKSNDSGARQKSEQILTLVNLSRTLFENPLSHGQAGSLLKSVDGDYILAEKKVREAQSARKPIAWLMAFAHRPEREVET